MAHRALLRLSLLLCACSVLSAQDSTLPRIDRSGAHPALLVDGKPYLMLGGQMNNSSAWPATMPAVWKTMEAIGANTLEAPVYWETLEPTEGSFRFDQVQMLLAQARDHHCHLVLLWFGTWKNGSSSYTPEWMKRNPKRFPLSRAADGKPLEGLSPFGTETLAADRRAFRALMQYLKEHDPEHTVLMVQVENETGVWGGTRDHGDAAERAFAQPVPELVRSAMGRPGVHGTWSQVFGAEADEIFSAWAISRYVEQVAGEGKAVYPLPLYVNAAVRNPVHLGPPGSFQSGAPTFDVLPLWHAAAPSLDGIEPDIYLPEYENYTGVIDQYALPWNAFFVPESGNSQVYAHYFFSVLGHGAFGFSPFGMDATGYSNYPLGAQAMDGETLAPYVLNYRIASPMMRELAAWIREDRVRGVAEDPAVHSQKLMLPGIYGGAARWVANVDYGLPSFYTSTPAPGNPKPEGQALVVVLAPDEFLVAGAHCRVDFAPVQPAGGKQQRMWLIVEEGAYHDGTWTGLRRWNGDQTDYGLNFTDRPQVLRVRLTTY